MNPVNRVRTFSGQYYPVGKAFLGRILLNTLFSCPHVRE
jgi:hypothetical protein